MRPLVVAILALALLPATAGAVTLVNPDGSVAQPYQGWADALKIKPPDVTVVLHEGRCPRNLLTVGCVSIGEAAVFNMYVDPTTPMSNTRGPRGVLAHEIGHIFHAYTPQWFDAVFRKIMRVDWRVDIGEAVAEGYRYCAHRPDRGWPRFRTTPYDATPRQHRRVCRLLNQ